MVVAGCAINVTDTVIHNITNRHHQHVDSAGASTSPACAQHLQHTPAAEQTAPRQPRRSPSAVAVVGQTLL